MLYPPLDLGCQGLHGEGRQEISDTESKFSGCVHLQQKGMNPTLSSQYPYMPWGADLQQEGTPLVPGDAEQPLLALGPDHLLDISATEQPAAAARDLTSTAHAARLNLSAEQMVEVAADKEQAREGVREAAGSATVDEHTPRSAKDSASQVKFCLFGTSLWSFSSAGFDIRYNCLGWHCSGLFQFGAGAARGMQEIQENHEIVQDVVCANLLPTAVWQCSALRCL